LFGLFGSAIKPAIISLKAKAAACPGWPEGACPLVRTASMRERAAMYNANALKVGLFGAHLGLPQCPEIVLGAPTTVIGTAPAARKSPASVERPWLKCSQ